jgi:hypothetical protein
MRSLRYIGTVLMLLIAFLQGANAREESETSHITNTCTYYFYVLSQNEKRSGFQKSER